MSKWSKGYVLFAGIVAILLVIFSMRGIGNISKEISFEDLYPKKISQLNNDYVNHIMNFLSKGTEVQNNLIQKDFIGTQIIITGFVFDVENEKILTILGVDGGRISLNIDDSGKMAFCYFSELSKDILNLQKKMQITVYGSLNSINGLWVSISDCKLVLDKPDTNK